MSAILDRGSLLFATSAVVIISLLLELSLRGTLSFSLAFLPLLALAVLYVPSTLLLTNLIARLGGLSMVFQRDYSPLLTCAAMAWAAVNLPIAVSGWLLPFPIVRGAAILAYLYFAVLMIFAVRTVFGTENRIAAGVVSVSWIPLLAAPFLWGPLSLILRWLTSPFLLFFAFYYLRGELANLGAGLRSRQQFHRMLEAAAVNPHDGDAQYQLGLIYQQRRQYTEAIRRFKNAVTIDPAETDAHFQLGRIALEQDRLSDALEHLQTVFVQDEKYNSNEILRELGALYVTAGQSMTHCGAWRSISSGGHTTPRGCITLGSRSRRRTMRRGRARCMNGRSRQLAPRHATADDTPPSGVGLPKDRCESFPARRI